MKQRIIRAGTKLSGRNINLENVGQVLRTGAGDRSKTDGREFVVDSLKDWKPVEMDVEVDVEMGKHGPTWSYTCFRVMSQPVWPSGEAPGWSEQTDVGSNPFRHSLMSMNSYGL